VALILVAGSPSKARPGACTWSRPCRSGWPSAVSRARCV